MRLLIFLVYLGVGLVVAGNHHYLGDLNNLSHVVSAVLAVVLWPLVLLGVDLHIGGIPNVKVDNGG